MWETRSSSSWLLDGGSDGLTDTWLSDSLLCLLLAFA